MDTFPTRRNLNEVVNLRTWYHFLLVNLCSRSSFICIYWVVNTKSFISSILRPCRVRNDLKDGEHSAVGFISFTLTSSLHKISLSLPFLFFIFDPYFPILRFIEVMCESCLVHSEDDGKYTANVFFMCFIRIILRKQNYTISLWESNIAYSTKVISLRDLINIILYKLDLTLKISFILIFSQFILFCYYI